jgi:hypothetical protein
MITNLVESFNNVVKGIRALPIKVIVESSFKKIVKYFNDRKHEANHGKDHFPSKIWSKFVKNGLKGRSHRVLSYDQGRGIFGMMSNIMSMGRKIIHIKLILVRGPIFVVNGKFME